MSMPYHAGGRPSAWLRVTLPLLSAGLMAGGACNGSPRGYAAGEAGADQALADTLAALIAAAYDFERPDVLERMSGLYPDTGQVVSASAGHLATSADSVRAGIATFWADAGRNMREARWQWGEVHAYRLGRDAAVLTGDWSIPHIAPAGNEHVIRGAWTAVFRRTGGAWTIVHEHLSAPPD